MVRIHTYKWDIKYVVTSRSDIRIVSHTKFMNLPSRHPEWNLKNVSIDIEHVVMQGISHHKIPWTQWQ